MHRSGLTKAIRRGERPQARLKWFGRAAVALAALAASFVADGTAVAGAASSNNGTLTIASGISPASLNPAMSAIAVPVQFYGNLAYEPLIIQDVNGKFSPGLAVSWHYVGTGNTTFSMQLRPNVRFSDGAAMTAAGVAQSINYYLANSEEPMPLGPGVSVTATGPLTVQITLQRSDPVLPYTFSEDGPAGWIISPTGLADPTALGNSTHGAGPYMLDPANTIANSKYTYVPNPYYYDKSAIHWKKVVVDVITNPSAELAALATGQAQVMQGESQLVATAKSDGLKITSVAATNGPIVMQAHITSTTSPLANQKVRQALSYAIDRNAIQKAFFGKYATNDQEMEGPGDLGYVPALAQKYSYDPAKAKRLLAQAGYPHGFSTNANCSPQLDQAVLCQAVKSYWAKIGVNLDVASPIQSVWISNLIGGKFDFTGIGDFENSAYVQTQGSYQPGLETGTYAIPGLASVYQQASAAPVGSAKAASLWKQVETIEMNASTVIEIASPSLIMFSKNVSGISFSPGEPVPYVTQWKPA
ncbi:MAG: ABC transporter substrate-binding protein [Acidimicrobiales bacterium]